MAGGQRGSSISRRQPFVFSMSSLCLAGREAWLGVSTGLLACCWAVSSCWVRALTRSAAVNQQPPLSQKTDTDGRTDGLRFTFFPPTPPRSTPSPRPNRDKCAKTDKLIQTGQLARDLEAAVHGLRKELVRCVGRLARLRDVCAAPAPGQRPSSKRSARIQP